ncbi:MULTISPECIES: DUF2345 domain-containing protein [unclassified Serratia (in: enterobacteria)]|uniref:DUF2345 domain-containing protein n=1 Tax=unclassified Serratia (in: enterobacteria) TaxID=2647522 RepID=UPI002ECFF164|nr:DUF2345 domain-containing protein [Serratia sp. C2(2)]MEE4447200.1 DUF2345 domain-containing protein [Serratia sp. C2(1)]
MSTSLPIRFSHNHHLLAIKGCESELDVLAFEGNEALSKPFNYSMELLVRKGISIVSAEDEIKIIAKKKLTLNGGGSYITLDVHAIESATLGDFRTRAGHYARQTRAQHKPDISPLANAIDDGGHNIRYLCADDNGTPMLNTPYRASLADGSVLEGVSDGEGYTKLFTSAQTQDVLLHMMPGVINA